MKILGITGGIGMGKSTAGDLLELRGIPIIDTDALARRETEPGSQALVEIREAFGPEFFDPDGKLIRSKLARVIFLDVAARNCLESILHPRIVAAWRAQIVVWQTEGYSTVGVLIPLLFERGYENQFSTVVSVVCSCASQLKRLRDRGWSDSEIEARKAAQLPVAEKMIRSKFVVWTEGLLTVHGRQWDQILTVG